MDSAPPLSLADVTHDSDFPIDPTLGGGEDDLFLPEGPEDDHNKNGDHDLDAAFDDAAVSAIKASLSQAQAQAELHHATTHSLHNHNNHHDNNNIDHINTNGNGDNNGLIDTNAIGTENNPIENPMVHMAPYSRAERGDHTPHPEFLLFPMKEMFVEWLNGESSWCHFVQRRTTTPAKRAEERIKARIKAHEKMLMEMTPDEAANTPPLKRRKRQRTSPVVEKVTYTCHHAGSYVAKHSSELPQAKLRLNTKTSVKCNCPSKIVLTELEEGICRVSYYWKHEGHDPFSDTELDTGRLPKIVDDWLIEQINKGKDTDEIRAMLSISEEAKEEYVRRSLADPSTVDPNLPPPIAFQMKIKYPDIYNRFRKLRGPIRKIKIPKCRQDQMLDSNQNSLTPNSSDLHSSVPMSMPNLKATANDEADEPPMEEPDDLTSLANVGVGVGVGVEGLDMIPPPPQDNGMMEQGYNPENDLDTHPHAVLARFAEQQGHSDLAQALLSLPRDPGYGEEDRLEDSVEKAAKAAAAAAAEAEDDDKSDGWGDINPL